MITEMKLRKSLRNLGKKRRYIVKLSTPVCRGNYAESWVKKIGNGYFVRLYTKLENHIQLRKAIEIGVKIAEST